MVDILNCDYMIKYANDKGIQKAFFKEELEIFKFIAKNKVVDFEIIDFRELPF